MKNLLLFTLLMGSLTSFSQVKSKTKNIDGNVNVLLDSISKVYHVKSNSIVVESYGGITKTSISYIKNQKLIYKVIKIEND